MTTTTPSDTVSPSGIRWRIVFLTVILCVIPCVWIAVWIGRELAFRAAEQHLAEEVSRATTVDEELQAFALVSQSGGQYAVRFFDSDDREMHMSAPPFALERVYSIEIQFYGGTRVKRRLCQPGNLGILLSE